MDDGESLRFHLPIDTFSTRNCQVIPSMSRDLRDVNALVFKIDQTCHEVRDRSSDQDGGEPF